ncbi:MAG: alginate export family protein [Verrucomicrobiota bacterium]
MAKIRFTIGVAPAAIFCLGLSALISPILEGQDQDRTFTDLPPLRKLAFQEDARGYQDLQNSPRLLEQIKFVQLGDSPDNFISFGGLIRQRYEYLENPDFGETVQDDDGAWLQRYMAHGDLYYGDRFRAFVQLISAVVVGRETGPSPVDDNHLDFLNAFVDLKVVDAGESEVTVRAVRQELEFGSGRLVDAREGPNVRRTFDAARLLSTIPSWRIDALFGRPVETREGVFDDVTNNDQSLWGVYATADAGLLPIGHLDVYYLGYQNNESTYTIGTAKETRHTLGTRFFGTSHNFDWNWEAMFQFGDFGSDEILAWSIATDTGYTVDQWAWTPRFAINANVASGNRDPDSSRLNTFNPLYPRGNYFSDAAILGPRNFFNLHPFVTVSPTDDWEITADVNFFWRLETTDGVYSPSGQIIRAGLESNERYVGTAFSLNTSYALTRELSFTAIYSHFAPGSFIEDTGPSQSLDFFEVTIQFRF